jgi:hypothetical protein
MRKKLIILAVLAVALLLGELARERAMYIVQRRKLEASYWTIDKQMRAEGGLNKKDIQKMVGSPEKVTQDAAQELWRWSAQNSQGRLWQMLRLASDKGHYELDVEFDKEGQVANVYSGVN